MAFRTTSLSDIFNDDTAFRNFCTVIHNHLAASLTQTADTGQINLTTVTKPTLSNTLGGYEIWRFNDSLQATAPIFLKVEYRTGVQPSYPAIYLTIGSGSNGSGTLTASAFPDAGTVTSSRGLMHPSGASAGVTASTYMQSLADGSGFALLMWPTNMSGVGGGLVAIERFRNPDGTANGDGYTAFYSYFSPSVGASAWAMDARYFVSVGNFIQPASYVVGWNSVFAPFMSASIAGTTLYPWPVFTGATPRLAGVSKLLFAIGATGDMSAGATFSLTHYGASTTWLCAGPGYSTAGWTQNGTGYPRSFAIRAD